jgi:hypothetical protein
MERFREPSQRVQLSQFSEFIQGDSQLSEDFVEQRWTDLASSMNGDRHSPPIRMIPSFMTTGLSRKNKSYKPGNALEVARRRARHSLSRSCQKAEQGPFHGTPQR